MSILRARTQRSHRVYLVRPVGDFSPTSWQQRPERFTIVRRLETTERLGRADALRWLHNNEAAGNDSIGEWAVVLPQQKRRVAA